jgi:transcription antitermination protein NusB
MSIPQQKLREIVLQLLYSDEIGKPNDSDMITLIMQELAVTKRVVITAQDKAKAVCTELKTIDEMISKVSLSYDLNRIHAVIRNILRLGIYELFFDDTIPPRVAIAEAMRLARKFGTPEAGSFVNALLDNLYQVSQGHQISVNELEKKSQEMAESEELAKKAADEALLNLEAKRTADDDDL